MSQFDNLVYDRTSDDVDYRNELKLKMQNGTATATEIAEWNEDSLKGAYNYTDLNRVGTILTLVKTLSDEIGMSLTYPYTVVSNYTKTNLPTGTDVSHLLANVSAVKTVYAQWISTVVPDNIKSVDGANAIEWLLAQVEPIIDGTKNAYQYSADLYCGGN